MSLFRPDIWFPESLDFVPQFVNKSHWLPDYIAANLLMAIFATFQVLACWHISSAYRHRRPQTSKFQAERAKRRTSAISTGPISIGWCSVSVALASLYLATAIIYWTVFGQRYVSLKTLVTYAPEEEVRQWFHDNPNEKTAKIFCVETVQPHLCTRFQLTKNSLAYKAVELLFASLVEAIILLSDGVLIYRFFLFFWDAAWAKYATASLICLALAGPIMGIVVLAKIGELGTESDPWLGASFSGGPFRFLYTHTPYIAIGFAVLVNIIVTASIVIRIARSRKTIAKLNGRVGQQPVAQSVYSGVIATLIESAFPAALAGVAAALIPVASHINGSFTLDVLFFTPKTLWIGLTALAPQLIILRVLKGRSWTYQTRRGPLTSAEVPLAFQTYQTDNTMGLIVDIEQTNSGIERPPNARLTLSSVIFEQSRLLGNIRGV